jgi:2Fe-2S ferredoxin
MTTLVVTDAHAQEHIIDAADGLSLMEILRPLDIGVRGECEGSISCASCHIWIESPWLGRLDPPSDAEADMLDCAFHVRAASRLCCQIRMQSSLDGLRVTIPGG